MGTKKLVSFALVLGLGVLGIIYLRNHNSADPSLHVYTWSNYFPENIISEFTQKTGIPVKFTYFSSNEELLAKLKAGATGFDIIQPSDYMVRQMKALDLLEPLELEKLDQYVHLDPFYTQLPYDPGNQVSIPFTWGTTGIAINTEKVSLPPEGVSWAMLTKSSDPNHTSLLDDMREVFGIFLLMNGYSLNEKRMEVLREIKPNIQKAKNEALVLTSECKPMLVREEIYVAHAYSVDAIQAKVENPKIEYFIPKEGGTIWTDNFSVPKSAKHKAHAYTFINYFLNPENAYKLITENHLATPNKTAKEKLPKEILENPNLYPPVETLEKLTFLEEIGPSLQGMSQLWTEIKI